jgi:excisionase family DNA binding protein
MKDKLPNSISDAVTRLKTHNTVTGKSAYLHGFSSIYPLQHCLGHCKGQPGAKFTPPGAILASKAPEIGPFPPLGIPLSIREVARMIGCSPWTVRQTLIPQGLPFFRSGASGKLIFYRDQVVRWIEQIQGGQTTK